MQTKQMFMWEFQKSHMISKRWQSIWRNFTFGFSWVQLSNYPKNYISNFSHDPLQNSANFWTTGVLKDDQFGGVGARLFEKNDGFWARNMRLKHHTYGNIMENWWLMIWLVVWNIFFPYIGNVIIPTDEHIFQRGRLKPPTRWVYSPSCGDYQNPRGNFCSKPSSSVSRGFSGKSLEPVQHYDETLGTW